MEPDKAAKFLPWLLYQQPPWPASDVESFQVQLTTLELSQPKPVLPEALCRSESTQPPEKGVRLQWSQRCSELMSSISSAVLSFGEQALELSRAEYGLHFAEREEKKRTWRWFYTGPAWDSKDPAFATGFDFSKISCRSTEALQFLPPSFQQLVRCICNTSSHMHMYIHTNTNAHNYAYIHTCIHIYTHGCIHIYIFIYIYR